MVGQTRQHRVRNRTNPHLQGRAVRDEVFSDELSDGRLGGRGGGGGLFGEVDVFSVVVVEKQGGREGDFNTIDVQKFNYFEEGKGGRKYLLKYPIKLRNMNQSIPQRPRHLPINMPHHMLRTLHPRPHDIHTCAQRAIPVLVRRRDLDQSNVYGQNLSSEKIRDLREVDGNWKEGGKERKRA